MAVALICNRVKLALAHVGSESHILGFTIVFTLHITGDDQLYAMWYNA